MTVGRMGGRVPGMDTMGVPRGDCGGDATYWDSSRDGLFTQTLGGAWMWRGGDDEALA